jgi:thiamine-phosphate diphosphorylase
VTLPRLHVVTDGAVLRRPDFLERLHALAALGPRVAFHVRDRAAAGRALHDAATRVAAVARARGAMLVVNARPDVAAAVEADAVQLGAQDLSPAEARRVGPRLQVGRSVHGAAEAREAIDAGADFLVVGTIYPSESHPDLPPAGAGLIRAAARFGRPVLAIGGVRPGHAPELKDAGAWGVAVIRAVWTADDPLHEARALLAPWEAA